MVFPGRTLFYVGCHFIDAIRIPVPYKKIFVDIFIFLTALFGILLAGLFIHKLF